MQAFLKTGKLGSTDTLTKNVNENIEEKNKKTKNITVKCTPWVEK